VNPEESCWCGPTGIAPVLQVHPSRLCNLACAHCYTSSGPREQGELPWEILADCLNDAYKLGYRQLAVSGGEPLLYRSLVNLLSRARALGMITTVTSNGLLLSRDALQPLAPWVHFMAISIDGRPGEHDALRCRKGAFDGTVENLANLRAAGVAFGFIFTLTQHNIDSLEFVVRLAAAQGAKRVQVHPLTLHGRALKTLPGARPDGVELVAALLEASRLGDELGVPVQVDALTVEQLLEYRSHVVPERPITQLIQIAPVLVVEADGVVMPLTHEISRSLKLGSLYEARLQWLAECWLAMDQGERLADACERTWSELSANVDSPAVYWYDEVAART